MSYLIPQSTNVQCYQQFEIRSRTDKRLRVEFWIILCITEPVVLPSGQTANHFHASDWRSMNYCQLKKAAAMELPGYVSNYIGSANE